MKKKGAVLLLLVLAGCASDYGVSGNVYFPASSVQKAADKIIQEIWQPVHANAKGVK